MLLLSVIGFKTIDPSILRAGLACVPTPYYQLLNPPSDLGTALSCGLHEKPKWSAKTFSSDIPNAECGAPLSTSGPRRFESCKNQSRFAMLKERVPFLSFSPDAGLKLDTDENADPLLFVELCESNGWSKDFTPCVSNPSAR